jgi:hypothetical protein
MFEKLQAVARLMIIPTAVLYLCGFICMTGYLARFGIVTFDILNARFLIAGLHALLPLSFSLWLSWKVYKAQLDKNVYTYLGSLLRFIIYSELLVTPTLVALGFNALYTTADFHKMSNPDAFHFGPLGKWDLVGHLLSHLELGFGTKLAFYFCFYGLLVVLPLFVLVLLLVRTVKRNNAQLPAPSNDGLPLAQAAPPAQFPLTVKFFENDGVRNRTIVLAVDVVAIGILAAAGIYSWWRIRSELLDANTLDNLAFNSGLLVAWLYTTTFSILFFLVALPAGFAQLNFSNFGSWLNPSNVADALYRLVAPGLAALFLFGATIFPRLPTAVGGGMPRQVSLYLKEPDRQFAPGRKFMLGESSQFIFIVQISNRQRRAFQLNKDAIEALETWETNLPAAKPKQVRVQ